MGPRQVQKQWGKPVGGGPVMNWKAHLPSPLSSSCEGTVATQNSDSVLTGCWYFKQLAIIGDSWEISQCFNVDNELKHLKNKLLWAKETSLWAVSARDSQCVASDTKNSFSNLLHRFLRIKKVTYMWKKNLLLKSETSPVNSHLSFTCIPSYSSWSISGFQCPEGTEMPWSTRMNALRKNKQNIVLPSPVS